jgi:hypothetical protein
MIQMVEATVQLKNGDVFTTYARSFEGLFKRLEGKEIVKVVGRIVNSKDMRQGRDEGSWPSPK